ncbi:uncharacterized protein K489DRAFT_385243 [Dissoconium aciculare CBS 342.82]|uniref:Monopolin complex subunit Csm1/Pcs1 C-terminal domain-containing protein n=1 Tax=Dissoconium aciculare CBS 342.82 TaxID=1314786 RepID=A0A6J3LU32_9PEZI|nr:uncharacterized protein K489DRAFT_385243 [Dissoconium aciculare CBS 342.82]KAF1818127.1 hypothetical protein K489DRAFT_385243 [Dissoconium aciculare CBS 342.82]
MAPRTALLANNARAGGGSDSEDDLATTPLGTMTGDQNQTSNKATKSKSVKSTARRTSAGNTATKRKVAAPRKPRQALQDKTNVQAGSDTEEVEAFEDEMETEAATTKAKRAKTGAARKPAAKTATGAKRGRPAKAAQPPPEPLKTIPETQPDPQETEDIEQSIEVDPEAMDIARVPTPPLAARFVQRAPATAQLPLQPRPSGRAPSVPLAYIPQRERSNSAVALDRRGGDPELRRALNDVTKKYEDLQARYSSLEEIGKIDAERNFTRLKAASDQKSRDAHDLIASLKKELADSRKASASTNSEAATYQTQLAALQTSQTALTSERDDARKQLHLSQNENKALEAKLLAARQQIATQLAETKTLVEAAAARNPGGGRHAAPILASTAAEAQREAKMKEDLYSDLTGLIIRNVKRLEGEDVYDCIQTGRNGTLHFHLTLAHDALTSMPGGTTPQSKSTPLPTTVSYEETEFAYEPLLDPSRDRELLSLLPDYLTEEICFPRQHAQKFYARVLESMGRRVEIVDDEDDDTEEEEEE